MAVVIDSARLGLGRLGVFRMGLGTSGGGVVPPAGAGIPVSAGWWWNGPADPRRIPLPIVSELLGLEEDGD